MLVHQRAIAALQTHIGTRISSLAPSPSPLTLNAQTKQARHFEKSALLKMFEFSRNFRLPSSHAWTFPTPKYNRTKIESESMEQLNIKTSSAHAQNRLMAGPAKKRQREDASYLVKENVASGAILAKHGDVILELTKDGTSAGTLLVSSHVLSLASPVFGAMFSGNFAEGNDLSAAAPKRIALPDDDAESMTVFCKLIHMQTANLNREPSFDELADIAILCDKYRCTESIRSWLQLWISQKLKYPKEPKFEKLIFITYVCDLPRDFEQVTLVLLRDTTKFLNNTYVTHGMNLVPMEVIGKPISLAFNAKVRFLTIARPAPVSVSGPPNQRSIQALWQEVPGPHNWHLFQWIFFSERLSSSSRYVWDHSKCLYDNGRVCAGGSETRGFAYRSDMHTTYHVCRPRRQRHQSRIHRGLAQGV